MESVKHNLGRAIWCQQRTPWPQDFILFVHELTRQTLKSLHNLNIMKHANLLKTVTNHFALRWIGITFFSSGNQPLLCLVNMFTNWHQAEGIFCLLKTIPAVAGREGTSCTIQAWNKAWNSGESKIKCDGRTQKINKTKRWPTNFCWRNYLKRVRQKRLKKKILNSIILSHSAAMMYETLVKVSQS